MDLWIVSSRNIACHVEFPQPSTIILSAANSTQHHRKYHKINIHSVEVNSVNKTVAARENDLNEVTKGTGSTDDNT